MGHHWKCVWSASLRRKLNFSASVCKNILWNLTKFQLNQTTDRKNENKSCLNELNELKFCEVSQNCFSKRCWKFQPSILKNKKVLFLKKYDLSRSLWIGQDSSNRWYFTVPIFSDGFGWQKYNFPKFQNKTVKNPFTNVNVKIHVARFGDFYMWLLWVAK